MAIYDLPLYVDEMVSNSGSVGSNVRLVLPKDNVGAAAGLLESVADVDRVGIVRQL